MTHPYLYSVVISPVDTARERRCGHVSIVEQLQDVGKDRKAIVMLFLQKIGHSNLEHSTRLKKV